MERISASDLRKDAAEVFNKVAYGGERVILHRRGKDLAAVVSLDDLELLEAMDDQRDLEEARNAKRWLKRSGEKPIPLEDVARELDIELPHG
ncbi:MAG: type II toxin-antitoxin system Phd/YefM family antitoxin [Candidatus Hydrogenedentota bacterium]